MAKVVVTSLPHLKVQVFAQLAYTYKHGGIKRVWSYIIPNNSTDRSRDAPRARRISNCILRVAPLSADTLRVLLLE